MMLLATSISAQTLDFERPRDWFIASTNTQVKITDEKAFSGEKSLKYDVSDYGDLKLIGCQMSKGTTCSLNLKSGTYKVSLQIFLTDEVPESIRTVVKSGETTIPTIWKFADVKRGEWVELTNKIVVKEDIEKAFVSIGLFRNKDGSNTGCFYIDDMKFELE